MRSRCLMLAVAFVAAGFLPAAQEPGLDEPPWQAFIAAAGTEPRQAQAALVEIAARWRDGYAAMIVDVARFLPSPRGLRAAEDQLSRNLDGPVDEERSAATVARGEFPALPPQERLGADTRRRLTNFLERQTGKRFGDDLRAWRRWLWALPYAPHQDYASFKAELYARIDPRFREFFPSQVETTIRLDEIDWGGVGINGIPPLRAPIRSASSRGTRWRLTGLAALT